MSTPPPKRYVKPYDPNSKTTKALNFVSNNAKALSAGAAGLVVLNYLAKRRQKIRKWIANGCTNETGNDKIKCLKYLQKHNPTNITRG